MQTIEDFKIFIRWAIVLVYRRWSNGRGGGGGSIRSLAGFQPKHVASETGAKPEVVSLVKQTLHACSSQLIAPLILNDSAS